MTEYEIQPPSLRCAETARDLKPGELYYSVLIDSPEGFRRLDYSAEAWTGAPETAIGFWRSRVPATPRPSRPRPVADDVLMQFFERLAGDTDPTRVSFRYILSLLLLRRKVLRFADVVRDGGTEYLVLRASHAGDEYRVINPRLSDEELRGVEQEVGKILQGSVE